MKGIAVAVLMSEISRRGPSRALELADQLGLSGEERVAIKALLEAHKAQARAIGEKHSD